MAQSNISGPFNITNGLIVGGTAHFVGTVTDDGSYSAGGNVTAGTSVIWASGTAGQYTGVVTTGNVQAGTALVWPSGTATTYTGLTTVGNLTAGTSLIWPNGTANTSGASIRGALTTTGNATLGGTLTAGTTRVLFGTFPATAVVSASNMGDILFNNRPASGSATHWVCTAPGTPGTWLACGSAS
jgi:hypothetical protein